MLLRRPHARRAFTLIELLLVLVILAIVTAVVAPSMGGFAGGRIAGHAASQLVSVANWARNEAMREGVIYRLNVDVAGQTYWLTKQDEGSYDFVNTGEEFGRPFSMPEKVTLACDAPSTGKAQFIPFYPTGRTDPATLTLTDANGQVTRLASPSATEPFQVLPAGGQP